jgi:hypothetical protein
LGGIQNSESRLFFEIPGLCLPLTGRAFFYISIPNCVATTVIRKSNVDWKQIHNGRQVNTGIPALAGKLPDDSDMEFLQTFHA